MVGVDLAAAASAAREGSGETAKDREGLVVGRIEAAGRSEMTTGEPAHALTGPDGAEEPVGVSELGVEFEGPLQMVRRAGQVTFGEGDEPAGVGHDGELGVESGGDPARANGVGQVGGIGGIGGTACVEERGDEGQGATDVEPGGLRLDHDRSVVARQRRGMVAEGALGRAGELECDGGDFDRDRSFRGGEGVARFARGVVGPGHGEMKGRVGRVGGEGVSEHGFRVVGAPDVEQMSGSFGGAVGVGHDARVRRMNRPRVSQAVRSGSGSARDRLPTGGSVSSDELIVSIEAAVEAAPRDVALRAHLISLLVDAGRERDAVPHVRAGLELDPEHTELLEMSVRVLEALGDPKASPMRDQLDRESDRDPAAGSRRVTPEGYSADDFPDTVDELVDEWSGSAPIEEVDVGHLSAAGVTLADVGGLDRVKQQLERSFLAPIRNPEMAATFGKAAGGGLLLWGPPGCGKTFLARATAGEMGANFYAISLADVLDMWIGASERNLAYIFEVARENAPCVLFFDEIDAIGQKRSHLRVAGSTLRGTVNQLLTELDGVGAHNDGVFVLAATNHPWDVDEALLRPGRFDRRLLVLPPDEVARRSILEFHLRGKPTDGLDLDRVVTATDGYSGADLALIVEEATERALERSLDSGRVDPISTDAVDAALELVTPSIGPWLETARNHVIYANKSGDYDELEAFLRDYDQR